MRKLAAIALSALWGLAGLIAGYVVGAGACMVYMVSFKGGGYSHDDAFVTVPRVGLLIGASLAVVATYFGWRRTRRWRSDTRDD